MPSEFRESEFRENAEDLNTADPVQVDVNPSLTKTELDAFASLMEVEIPGTWARSERNALIAAYITAARRLFAEVESRGRAVEALSARLTAKNAELDKTIRESAADKVKLAEIGEGSEEWAIQVFHRPGGSGYYFHDSTGEDPEQDLADVLELLADGRDMAGNPIEHGPVSIVKRTVWSTEWKTVEPSEMPRPPAEEGCTCSLTDPSTWTRYGDAVEPGSMYEPNPDCPEHGAHTEILTAQERAGDTDTSPAGSGRGTGVAETPGTAQAGDAWREFSRVIDEEEPDDILAAALDIPGLWADENQPEAPAEAEHVTAVRSTYRPGYASVLLRLIADAETTTPYYRRPVIVQDGAITDAGFLRNAVAAVWGAVPHLLPSLPVPSTEEQ